MNLPPIDKSLNKSSPHSTTSILLHNINMKMCRIILANILNVTEIRDVVEIIEFRRIFQATCEISDCTPDVIKRDKKTVSMFYNISAKRHLSKILSFFVGAKITFDARFKKDVIQIAKVVCKIRNFICFLYIDDHFGQSFTILRARLNSGTGMNARNLAIICALLVATPSLIGCESSRDSPDRQFQKQVKRAEECRQLQDKLVGDKPLTPERTEEIAKTMDRNGCTVRFPAQ